MDMERNQDTPRRMDYKQAVGTDGNSEPLVSVYVMAPMQNSVAGVKVAGVNVLIDSRFADCTDFRFAGGGVFGTATTGDCEAITGEVSLYLPDTNANAGWEFRARTPDASGAVLSIPVASEAAGRVMGLAWMAAHALPTLEALEAQAHSATDGTQ